MMPCERRCSLRSPNFFQTFRPPPLMRYLPSSTNLPGHEKQLLRLIYCGQGVNYRSTAVDIAWCAASRCDVVLNKRPVLKVHSVPTFVGSIPQGMQATAVQLRCRLSEQSAPLQRWHLHTSCPIRRRAGQRRRRWRRLAAWCRPTVRGGDVWRGRQETRGMPRASTVCSR